MPQWTGYEQESYTKKAVELSNALGPVYRAAKNGNVSRYRESIRELGEKHNNIKRQLAYSVLAVRREELKMKAATHKPENAKYVQQTLNQKNKPTINQLLQQYHSSDDARVIMDIITGKNRNSGVINFEKGQKRRNNSGYSSQRNGSSEEINGSNRYTWGIGEHARNLFKKHYPNQNTENVYVMNSGGVPLGT
uniref:Uncharacterized protein n=1 Tax=viral metagenome TaxID=1070528 RepID=A0A6C0F5Z1_9ZZZZ|tara:strand:+ start:16715 stop:17293 length:579 start_codon:yes stop_codon:yes gene_type:complete